MFLSAFIHVPFYFTLCLSCHCSSVPVFQYVVVGCVSAFQKNFHVAAVSSLCFHFRQVVLDLGALPHLKVLLHHPKKNIRKVCQSSQSCKAFFSVGARQSIDQPRSTSGTFYFFPMHRTLTH